MSVSGGTGAVAGTPVNASASAGNAINTATLPAVVGQTNYLTGFMVTGAGSTAGLDVTVTVTGVAGGPLSYTFTAPVGALVPAQPLIVTFPVPLQGTAVNTAVSGSCPALGVGNTNASVVATGYVR
jgi:hypothetical protein